MDYNIDEYGLPTTSQRAVGKVTANVAIDEHVEGLLKIDQADEARIEQFLDYRHKHVKERWRPPPTPWSARRCWTKTRCSRTSWTFCTSNCGRGGLKEQYYPRPRSRRPQPSATGHVSKHHAQLRIGALIVARRSGSILIQTNPPPDSPGCLPRTISSLCLAPPGKAGSLLLPSR